MIRINYFLTFLLFISFYSCKKNSTLDNSSNSNPIPVISSISPNNATAGDPAFILTVTGTHFINGSTIKWNGVSLISTYVSTNSITANISATLISTPGIDSICVVNPTPAGGKSNTVAFNCSSVQTNPIPDLITITPASIIAGSSTFLLTVTGNNFISNSTILWNNTPLVTSYINSSQLTASINASLVASTGNASVTIVTPAPGGGTSTASNFTISAVGNNPVPSFISMTPNNINAGSSTFSLIVTGANFVNNSIVNWNGSALPTTFINANQLSATVSASLITNAGSANVTVVNPAPGGGLSSINNFVVNSQGATVKKFLFDATKAETAGNADWVIDEDNSNPQSIPTPAQSTVISSTSETYWTGAISSWGIALAKMGHKVETLPAAGSITYGSSSNTQDLSHYDVFVIDEPNTRFTTSEKQAILNFVNNGGGLFMISDHTQSDRDNDGWDSPAIWNDFMTNNGLINNPFGFSIDLTNISGTSSNVLSGNTTNVILHGSQGNVTQLDFSNGATLTLNNSINSTVQGLIWQSGSSQSSTNAISASSTYGTGRVYVVTDSSPMDDGSGAIGNTLYVGWSLFSHTKLFMNASLWLAKVQ